MNLYRKYENFGYRGESTFSLSIQGSRDTMKIHPKIFIMGLEGCGGGGGVWKKWRHFKMAMAPMETQPISAHQPKLLSDYPQY